MIDEKELVACLSDGSVAGIGTDVLKGEEVGDIQSSELWRAAKKGSNVLITPHIGGCTFEAMEFTENLIFEILQQQYFRSQV